jgi:hypothetical protein
MRALKYIGTFFGGFVCAFLLFCLTISPKDYSYGYRDGREYGIVVGQREAAIAIHKFLFEADTSDVISIETNGVKTIRVIP